MHARILWAFAALLAAASFAVSAQSFRPFVVKDIRVEGLQRTEPGTVFSYLPVKVGETMTEEKAQQALRALFATGFFRDVRLEVENDVLVVYVEERPAIAQIDFTGIREFEADVVRKVLREAGLAEGRIFDRSLLDAAEQELKRQYLSRGHYAAEVQTTVTPLERNRVGVNISVNEGDVAKIRGINIVGASAFRESELLELFVLRTPGWLTWYTKHDRYARERLAADLETLRSHYLNRGYLDFNVESTQVSITPDKSDIYITVNVTEGERYTVSQVDVAGQLLVPREELAKLVMLKPGDVFSRQKLTESTKAITDRLGNDGYAFANANAVPKIDREKRSVAFTILIDPGRRVYVRRVDVTGNTKTRDEVVRREMRQLEGAFYDVSKIQLSRRRIERTAYFDDVNVETRPVEGSADQVDVVYTVKEKSTGQLLLGVGFSSLEKIQLGGSISQTNIFGTGKHVSANVNSGKVNTVYSLGYLDPYYTVDGVSMGFDVYKREADLSSLSVGPYTTDSVGGGVRFGYPISESIGISFGANAENVKLQTFATSPVQYINFVNTFGSKYSYVSGTAGWTRDTRDNLILPGEGSLSRASAELGAGDLQYYRFGFEHRWFYPLARDYVLHLGADLGYARGVSGRPLPFFKSYYAGGPGTVRGYRSFSIGPQDPLGNALGGNRKISGTAEIVFPVPGASQDKSLRLSAFMDGAQVYGEQEKVDLGSLRYSAGIGLFWNSPFGPMRLSLANPLNKKPGDDIQRLQFILGSSF